MVEESDQRELLVPALLIELFARLLDPALVRVVRVVGGLGKDADRGLGVAEHHRVPGLTVAAGFAGGPGGLKLLDLLVAEEGELEDALAERRRILQRDRLVFQARDGGGALA